MKVNDQDHVKNCQPTQQHTLGQRKYDFEDSKMAFQKQISLGKLNFFSSNDLFSCFSSYRVARGQKRSHYLLYKNSHSIEYRMFAIISRSLYICCPIFYCGLYCREVSITDNLCTKQGNSSIFESKIRSL